MYYMDQCITTYVSMDTSYILVVKTLQSNPHNSIFSWPSNEFTSFWSKFSCNTLLKVLTEFILNSVVFKSVSWNCCMLNTDSLRCLFVLDFVFTLLSKYNCEHYVEPLYLNFRHTCIFWIVLPVKNHLPISCTDTMSRTLSQLLSAQHSSNCLYNLASIATR